MDAGFAEHFPVAVLEDGCAGCVGDDARHPGGVVKFGARASSGQVFFGSGEGEVDGVRIVDDAECPDESVVGVEAEHRVVRDDAAVGADEYAAAVGASEVERLEDFLACGAAAARCCCRFSGLGGTAAALHGH